MTLLPYAFLSAFTLNGGKTDDTDDGIIATHHLLLVSHHDIENRLQDSYSQWLRGALDLAEEKLEGVECKVLVSDRL